MDEFFSRVRRLAVIVKLYTVIYFLKVFIYRQVQVNCLVHSLIV